MSRTEKCPECGSRRIVQGELSGYANMYVKGHAFRSSKMIAEVCSSCGLVISLQVAQPEKFAPKER